MRALFKFCKVGLKYKNHWMKKRKFERLAEFACFPS